MISSLRTLLFAPRDAWARLGATPPGLTSVLLTWLLPLSVLPFVAYLIRFWWFASLFGLDASRMAASALIGDAAMRYGFIIVWTLVMAWVAQLLAPRFGAQQHYGRSLVAVAGSLAPLFVLSLLAWVPLVNLLIWAAVPWAIWLLRLAVPPMLWCPDVRAARYALTVALVGALLALLVLLPGCVYGVTVPGAPLVAELTPLPPGTEIATTQGRGAQSPDERLAGADNSGTGALSVDQFAGKSVQDYLKEFMDEDKLRELERLKQQVPDVEATFPFKPAEASALSALMPTEACGLPRVSLESTLSKLPKGDVALVKATFGTPGAQVVRMEIGDQSPMVFGLSQVRKFMPTRDVTTANGYQRMRSEGDVFIDDRWNMARKQAHFVMVLADRFGVSAIAEGVETPACAEAAVRGISWTTLRSLLTQAAR